MLPPSFTPAICTPRRSFGKLLYALVLGLTFAGATAAAHWAGTTWSPKPSWEQPAAIEPAAAPYVPPSRLEPIQPGCDQTTASGLQYAVLARHDGTHDRAQRPGRRDSVEVEFAGWDDEGTPLPGLPADGKARFRVDQLIPGWVEGLQLMTAGDQLLLCVPEELAYKDHPRAPQGTLYFEVTLLSIIPNDR